MATEVIPLKHLANVNERSLPDTTDSDREILYVDIGSVGRGELTDEPKRMRFGDAPTRARRLVQEGDTIVSTVRTYLRAVWPVTGSFDDVVVSTGFAVLTPRDIEPRYLSWWVMSDVFVEEVVARSVGISYPAVNSSELGEIRVRLPNVDEQRAIAEYLDIETNRIDALISKKYRLVELLSEYTDSVVLNGVSGRLTSPSSPIKSSRISWVGDIPRHFTTPWLGAFHTTQLGKMLNSEAVSGPDQYPYIKNTNVRWDHFDLDDLPTMTFDASDRLRCRLRVGDVLICEGGEVGRSAVWNQSSEIFFQKALHRVRPLGENVPRYLMYCLWAAAKLGVFEVEGNQATIVHLTGEKLREHRFPWPPLKEQEKIVELIDAERKRVDQITMSLRKQIELLTERRQALITAAVTGVRSVPVANV